MQRNNIIIFGIIAACIVGAWWFFLMPSEADRQKRAEEAQKAAEQRLAELKAKKKKLDEDAAEKAKLKKDKKPDEQKPDEKKQPAPVKDIPKEKIETVTLGGDGFHLTVDVTSLGAGVRKVVLNRFEAANWRGRLPTDAEGNPTHEKLQLIQDDPFAPSYRMYHFLDPKSDRPVLGLDEPWKKHKDGKVVVKDADGNVVAEEISFSTKVPGMEDIAIVKTYRLSPKDYHVGMKLTIENVCPDKNAKKILFRYQLAGAHGLPIEGEWYTTTYRNAFVALVEPNGRVWRKIEDSTRISLRRGGDRVPEASLDDNRLQYAGVANQFFGAMIVVEPEEGDTRPRNLLAAARPTLETVEKKGRITKLDYAKGTIEFLENEDDFSKRKQALTAKLKKANDEEEKDFFQRELDDEKEKLEYKLLPRTTHHLQVDLDVQEGTRIVLSSYKLPDGKFVATWARLGDSPRPQFDDITVRVRSEVLELFPGDKFEHPFMLYHGPVKVALLGQFTGEKAVPEKLVERYRVGLHLNTLTDYHNDNFFSREICARIYLTDVIILVTRFMHWLLYHLHHVFGWGLSIVVLTIMVRGAMFPISRRQALFSIKMQELGPELKKIQEKYPDDPQAKMQATQEFYKKHGINPLGSCWPVFLQMPIFLGLYFAFQESIHFRLADFLWIENLAAPDMIFRWGEAIWYISTPDSLGSMFYLGPFFNILPMIAVVFMMIQQLQTMPPPTDDQQAAQQKMLKYMTIFFGIMFYKVAAGLCIYFISSSLWGLAERRLLPKKKTVGAATAATSNSTAITAAAPASTWKGKNAKKEREREKEKDNTPPGTIGKLKALWREILKAAEKK